MALIDLAGKKFERLTVIRRAANYAGGDARWVCICDCGKELIVPSRRLRNGLSRSCGCLFYHRLSNSLTYQSWAAMKRRCLRPDCDHYHDYGGRGITICERWLGKDGFTTFLSDMGERTSRNHSIDRIDNDGNYEPGNCRWATAKEQRQNQRTGRMGKFIEFNGTRQCIKAWANAVGLEEATLYKRISRGWPLEEALNSQLKPSKWHNTSSA